jgi:hypothetical protein
VCPLKKLKLPKKWQLQILNYNLSKKVASSEMPIPILCRRRKTFWSHSQSVCNLLNTRSQAFSPHCWYVFYAWNIRPYLLKIEAKYPSLCIGNAFKKSAKWLHNGEIVSIRTLAGFTHELPVEFRLNFMLKVYSTKSCHKMFNDNNSCFAWTTSHVIRLLKHGYCKNK